MSIASQLKEIGADLPEHVTLVAVSKTKPASDILQAYEAGQRDFGENKIQEMVAKWEELPKDIRWHMIGHVQTNKVKYMAPFVHLVHGVDRIKVLQELDKQAKKYGRIIQCLLQIHIAKEETKFGFDAGELEDVMLNLHEYEHVQVVGLMGMASNTDETQQVIEEFSSLKELFDRYATRQNWNTLSMGMSGDYMCAIQQGSTMIRVGSAIFGKRNY